MSDIQILDRAADWAQLIETAYRDECKKINRRYPIERTLNIDMNLVPQDLFMHLLEKPEDAIEFCKGGIIATHLIPNWGGQLDELNVRFYNHPQSFTIKDMTSHRLKKFVSFEGVVRRVHSTNPDICRASFRCPCGRVTSIAQHGRDLTAPEETCTCGRKSTSQKLDPARSDTKDKQVIIVQEAPDKVRGSEVPASVSVILRDDCCKNINAGNRVVVTGVLNAFQQKPGDKTLAVEFEASHIEALDREFSDIEISPEEECEIIKMSEDLDIWDNIISSVAPSIFGNEDIKEAVALQLFGGVSDYNGDGTWKRGDIHILLIGDPGIAKSKMMDVVLSLCPRGIMTSGKGSSTAGLTAAAVQDGSGGWTLDAGAAVLADRGQLLIDEMDKMSPDDRSALHRAMEQQEVPINKAGINTVLKSRCSILAAANPASGRFDDYEDIASQFNLPPTLLSRFDLIFICRDVANESTDQAIADFILSSTSAGQGKYTPDMLRKYISYSKRIKPELSDAAKAEIAKFYVELRAMGGQGKPMPVTPRQLEGLRRLSQASARAHLRSVIEVSDAMKAIRIMKACLMHVAYDPEHGEFDIDRVCSTASKVKRDVMVELKATIIEAGKGEAVPFQRIISDMIQKGYDSVRVEKVLMDGYDNGAFCCPKNNTFKVM
jgi:replicative DNA helicase Mcm